MENDANPAKTIQTNPESMCPKTAWQSRFWHVTRDKTPLWIIWRQERQRATLARAAAQPPTPANSPGCVPLHPLRPAVFRERGGELRGMPGGTPGSREGSLQRPAHSRTLCEMRNRYVSRRGAVRGVRGLRRPASARSERRRAPAVRRAKGPPDLHTLRQGPQLRSVTLPALCFQGVRAFRACSWAARVRGRVHRRARRHARATWRLRALGGCGAVPVLRATVIR